MNPQASDPTPADDRPVTDIARRVGPPLVVASLVLTAALLAWMALAPTAVAGSISEAPFTVPATLVTPPDDAGCFDVVDGDGTSREHCLDELVGDEGDHRFAEVYFDGDGRLLAGRHPGYVEVDPATGEVLGTSDVQDEGQLGREPPEDRPFPGVHTSGDQVLQLDDGGETESVVLDLDGPPGYELHGATTSPDGAWVVTLTARGEVVAAPVDGSAAPHVWAEFPADSWVELRRGIRWDG